MIDRKIETTKGQLERGEFGDEMGAIKTVEEDYCEQPNIFSLKKPYPR